MLVLVKTMSSPLHVIQIQLFSPFMSIICSKLFCSVTGEIDKCVHVIINQLV